MSARDEVLRIQQHAAQIRAIAAEIRQDTAEGDLMARRMKHVQHVETDANGIVYCANCGRPMEYGDTVRGLDNLPTDKNAGAA